MDDKTLKNSSAHTYRIRAIEPRDAVGLAALMSEDDVYPNTLQTPFTPESIREERLAKHDMANLNLAVVTGEGSTERLIASCGLFQPYPNLRRRHVRSLGICIAGDWQRKGLGKVLMATMLDWADNWANVLRIELEVFEDNAHGIALYTQYGFVKEGLKRGDSFRNGEYANSVCMARLHPKQPMLRFT
jgi:L-phenylalanine/L-methionine N-acetyltransferase